jgi:hypothetical protein
MVTPVSMFVNRFKTMMCEHVMVFINERNVKSLVVIEIFDNLSWGCV